MNARSATQLQPASLLSGLTDRRLATIAKILRSTAWASSRPPPPASMIGRGNPTRVPPPRPARPPRAPHRALLDDRHSAGGGRGNRLCRIQEPADRAHQPRQPLPVDLVRAPEAVDDPSAWHAGVPVALVLRQRQIRDGAPVRVAPLRLAQIHAPTRLASSPDTHNS